MCLGAQGRNGVESRGGVFILMPVGNATAGATWRRAALVHPHARGERGVARLRAVLPERFIPTPVGNAALAIAAAVGGSVHPHARGERSQNPVQTDVPSGSSPRPWGTRRPQRLLLADHRFIPTPVGNAALAIAAAVGGSVHPHARGERSQNPVQTDVPSGSSPRPWGTRRPQRLLLADHRFIPTPVGNAARPRRPSRRATVHPHARGERSSTCANQLPPSGSSPRPWGTRAEKGREREHARFIPTPVGNAISARSSGRGRIGSSPRPWGTRHRRPTPASARAVHPHARGERERAIPARPVGPWFIPTPVGNAAWRGSRRCRRAVHPHARGERAGRRTIRPRPERFISTPVGNASLIGGGGGGAFGSSPRPWGTPWPSGC